MNVKEIMHSIMRLPHDSTVAEIASAMDNKLTGSVLLEEAGEVVGIVTERDILRKVVAKKKNPSEIKGHEIASSPLITVDAGSPLDEASSRMHQNNIRRILITENEKVVGKLTANAILKNARYLTAKSMFRNRG
ncbi:MAG: CBS domain-containing protein [Candidatus Woesearchaeota archaeon]